MEDVNMKELPQSVKDPQYTDVPMEQRPDSVRQAAAQNNIIQNVLLIALDARNLNTGSPAAVMVLPGGDGLFDVGSTHILRKTSLFDVDNVVHPFFERMLMSGEQLRANIVVNPTGKWIDRYGRADEADVMAYLGECYIRLQQERRNANSTAADLIYTKLEELILNNIRLGFEVPALFPSEDFPQRLVAFYFQVMDQHSEIVSGLIHKMFSPSASDFTPVQAANSLLKIALEKAKKFTLMNMQEYDAVIAFVVTFSSNPTTAKLLMAFCTPSNSRDAVGCEQSLLGVLLRLSCLPEHSDVPPDFFVGRVGGVGVSEAAAQESFIWTNTNRAIEGIFQVVNNIVRHSGELREAFLRWVGDCLSANFARAKMWQPNMQFQIRLASDGFMLNLSAVLLKLCRPFVNPTGNSRILKIHPLFPAFSTLLRKMPEETTLLPKDNLSTLSNPGDFNFITSCFFLCHETIRLGWGVVWERFNKLNKYMNEIQGRLEQARELNNVTEQQEIEDAIQRAGSRILSMKAALTVPQVMELMIELSVCTATWLCQMAVQPSIMTADLPTAYLPLFPTNQNSPIPIQLAYIPELLVENVIEILLCNQRLPVTTGSTMDWKFEWMVELMNMVLVFMPCPTRIKNPHLRAKMAMMMHNLMPHKRMADTYQDNRNVMALALLDGLKEKLFREHPNVSEFMEAILNIFVSIEMAGANLRFGEAYHYRRPLYALMEFLFTIDCHRARVEELAGLAVGNLEATNPPIFLRFLNLLINDQTYMLGETFNYMAKIKQLEQERPSWISLTPQQREEKERDFQQQGEIARYHNILGRETIQCLKSLTEFRNPARLMLNKVLVDRLATMLNFFLNCLVVADKRTQYKVKDPEHYSFDPKNLVAKICAVYINLGQHDARKDFFLAICQDQRSYNPQLFKEAVAVLRRFSGELIRGIEELAENVEKAQAAENEEEEFLADEDVPDSFMDPILSHLMRDPVRLPSSGVIVDRSTIARILLSDQSDPFNRQPLTMDQVKPAEELRKEIEQWIQKRREATAGSTSTKE